MNVIYAEGIDVVELFFGEDASFDDVVVSELEERFRPLVLKRRKFFNENCTITHIYSNEIIFKIKQKMFTISSCELPFFSKN
jgi:hypothetical protein